MIGYATDNDLLNEFEKALSWFNFERVVIVMNALNWDNYKDEYGSYKIHIMKEQFRSLFNSALILYHASPSDDIIMVESGGFQVNLFVTENNGPGVALEFVITSSESYKDI